MDWLPDIDWTVVGSHVREMAMAYILALPIGWDREARQRTAGLRTFPLVALASCAYTLIGFQVLDSTEAEGRVLASIITGIGFIGGGAILKTVIDGKGEVQGTATAASLWVTGAIGLAVAAHRLEIALLLSAVTFFTLRVMTPAKRHIREQSDD